MGAEYYGNDVLVYYYIKRITPVLQDYLIEVLRSYLHKDWWMEGVVRVETNNRSKRLLRRASEDESDRRRWLDITRCCSVMLSNGDIFFDPVDENGEDFPLIEPKYLHWLRDGRNFNYHLGTNVSDNEAIQTLMRLEDIMADLDEVLADEIRDVYEALKEGNRPTLIIPTGKGRRKMLPPTSGKTEYVSLTREQLDKLLKAERLAGYADGLRKRRSGEDNGFGTPTFPVSDRRDDDPDSDCCDSVTKGRKVSSSSLEFINRSEKSNDSYNEKSERDSLSDDSQIKHKICLPEDKSEWKLMSLSLKSSDSIYKKHDSDELCYSLMAESEFNNRLAEIYYNDGLRYYEDPESDPEFKLMIESLVKSARLDYGPAQYALACAYCSGLAEGKSFEDAYCLFELSLINGIEDSKFNIEALEKMNLACDKKSELYLYYQNEFLKSSNKMSKN